MAFFAAGVVKGALVIKHEVKKNRIRNSVISAPGSEDLADGEGTVSIQPDWWGGDGGSYPHHLAPQPEEDVTPNYRLTKSEPPSPTPTPELNQAKEETDTVEKPALDPPIPVVEIETLQPRRTSSRDAPAGSFSAQLRRGRSLRTEMPTLSADAAASSAPTAVAGSFSAEHRRIGTHPLPPRPASFAAASPADRSSAVTGSFSEEMRRARARASVTIPLTASVDNATSQLPNVAGSFSVEMRRSRPQSAVSPLSSAPNNSTDTELRNATTLPTTGPMPGSFAAASTVLHASQRFRQGGRRNAAVLEPDEGARRVMSTPSTEQMPGSFAAASTVLRASQRFRQGARARTLRRNAAVLEPDEGARRVMSTPSTEQVRPQARKPRSGSFMEATTTNTRTPNAEQYASRTVPKYSKQNSDGFNGSAADVHAISSAGREGM